MKSIFIAKSRGKGRGVFAARDYSKDDIIEICPVIILTAQERKLIDRTVLYNYYFSWSRGRAALGLGCSSLYNHSYTPNAKYVKDLRKRLLRYVCIRPIRRGEEVLVNYNGNPDDRTRVWFEATGRSDAKRRKA